MWNPNTWNAQVVRLIWMHYILTSNWTDSHRSIQSPSVLSFFRFIENYSVGIEKILIDKFQNDNSTLQSAVMITYLNKIKFNLSVIKSTKRMVILMTTWTVSYSILELQFYVLAVRMMLILHCINKERLRYGKWVIFIDST